MAMLEKPLQHRVALLSGPGGAASERSVPTCTASPSSTRTETMMIASSECGYMDLSFWQTKYPVGPGILLSSRMRSGSTCWQAQQHGRSPSWGLSQAYGLLFRQDR